MSNFSFSPAYFYVTTPWSSDKLDLAGNNMPENCREPPPNNVPVQQTSEKGSEERYVFYKYLSFIKKSFKKLSVLL